MHANELMRILSDNAYVRTSGTHEELRCANYFLDLLSGMDLQASLQSFPVEMFRMDRAELTVDGVSYPCTGYFGCGCHDVEAELYYLRYTDPVSLSYCRGKIVLLDTAVGFWKYQDLLSAGAVGYITCNGDVFKNQRDINQKEQRSYVHQGHRMPAVNIHCADAIDIVRRKGKQARIVVRQEQWEGESHNVIVDIPGQIPEYIAFTAHYDSAPLSIGVYDNLSGCAGLVYLAEYFAKHPPYRSLRFIFCGSEERGLLGAKFYCAQKELMEDCVLNINMDMIGCLMGKFLSCVTGEEAICHYISAMSSELGFANHVYQGIFSSDSTPFADKNVPAISFGRVAIRNMAGYHDRYDIMEVMDGDQMAEDFEFVLAFAKRMAEARRFPFDRKMPDNIRQKLDNYLGIKRMD